MKTLLVLFLVASCVSLAADGDIFIQTGDGYRAIPAAEAKVLQGHNQWLGERMTEATAIKEGGSYADLQKNFHMDGGLQDADIVRFTHNLAWNLKVDVTFESKVNFEKPDPGLKIKNVSRPYLQAMIID